MANVIPIDITANVNDFLPSIEQVKKSLADLEERINRTKDGSHKFNVHMLTSRHTLSMFADIVGASSGALSHMVHAFMALPGPIGLVLGGLYLLKHCWDEQSESMRKVKEEQNRVHESFRQLNEEYKKLLGERNPYEHIDEHIRRVEKEYGEAQRRVNEFHRQLEEFRGSDSSLYEEVPKHVRDQYELAKAEAERLRNKYETSKRDREKMMIYELANKGGGGGGGYHFQATSQLGVFKLEHSMPEELQYLKQIAKNTTPEPGGVSKPHGE